MIGKGKILHWLPIALILLFAIIPLFFSFPYRVNIFLSWEGAYRLYLGQVPFKDYGIPMGYGYWLIPSFFFHLFGPYMSSLIKAQVFINILSGSAFLFILRAFDIKQSIKVLCVLVFCISYSFFNFWPWYNHSVIVYQLIATAFLLNGILKQYKFKNLLIIASAFFTFLSFFTKQDGGGLSLIILSILLLVNAFYTKSLREILVFFLSLIAVGAIFIVPLLEHDFGYWFNLGQEPHNSRLSIKDFADIIFGESQWIKFYLLIITLVLINKGKDFRLFVKERKDVIFYLLIIGIMVEALLFQVTSYTPPNNNIFFHSFAFLFIITQVNFNIDVERPKVLAIATVLVMLWWSGTYWKYVDRVIKRAIPSYGMNDGNKISIKTFMRNNNKNNIGMDKWVFSSEKAFQGVYMPESTVKGIENLKSLPAVKGNDNPRVLNMTELTPLAHAIPYELEKGLPLWYHEGVGMFPEQTKIFIDRVENHYYDVILFETIPYLNNFFPENVRQAAIKEYEMVDKFLAPRRPTDSYIEVYIKKMEP